MPFEYLRLRQRISCELTLNAARTAASDAWRKVKPQGGLAGGWTVRGLSVPVVPPRPLLRHVTSLEIRLDPLPPAPCRVAVPTPARQPQTHHVTLLERHVRRARRRNPLSVHLDRPVRPVPAASEPPRGKAHPPGRARQHQRLALPHPPAIRLQDELLTQSAPELPRPARVRDELARLVQHRRLHFRPLDGDIAHVV